MVSESPQARLTRAMSDPDRLVVSFEYRDKKGNLTRRVVSPIRFTSTGSFLGLCLGREEPRRFDLQRCTNLALAPAHEFCMPVEIGVPRKKNGAPAEIRGQGVARS